jgi:hypothetical protein
MEAISQHFGPVVLSTEGSRAVPGTFSVEGARVPLELTISDHDHLDEAAVHKVDYRLRFLPELIDSVRERITQELDDDESAASQFRHFHCQNLGNGSVKKVFGVEDPAELTPEVFVRALRLARVGIYPGQPERYFVLDLTLGEGFTDEMLVAAADADGVVDDEILWD